MNKIAKSALAAVLILLTTIACIVFASATYAVWQRKVTADKEVEIPVGEYNPSLKYLKFLGLNSSMEFADTGITQYAVVGYDGLVAEIIIPSTYNGLPVVLVTTDPENTGYRFSNNEIITSIVIPVSVIELKSAVFSGMTSLRKVTIKGTKEDADIEIQNMAFGGCISLNLISCNRKIIGDIQLYAWGTPLI